MRFLARSRLSATRGFTLVELLIVVVIVGILAAVGYPSYREHVMRSTRAEGRAALLDIASRQEQYFLDNKSYTASLGDLLVDDNSESGAYALRVDAATAGCPLARCYVLRATPRGGQADDADCGALTLSADGARSATGPEAGGCW